MSETAKTHVPCEQGAAERSLITLAIFSYNQEDFIAEAIEGALAQTYSPLEIIISDDCSTDRTFEAIQSTLKDRVTPHEIRINRNDQNLGVCAHVNKVFEMARGRLIVMNGGDDVSLPSRVQKIHDAWIAYKHPGAIHSRWIDIDENGVEINIDRPSMRIPDGGVLDWNHPNFLKQVENAHFFHYTGAALAYDLNVVRDIFPALKSQLFNEDQVLPFRACLIGGFVYLPDQLLKYRQHSQNLHSLHKREQSQARSLYQREALTREVRMRRLLRYQAHIEDLDLCLNGGNIKGDVQKLRDEIEEREIILRVLVEWWEMNFVQRLLAFSTRLRRGSAEDRRWAAKRLLPWPLFKLLVTRSGPRASSHSA